MTPVQIDLPDILAGDTWEGLSIGPVLFDDTQPELPLQSCYFSFQETNTKRFAYGFRSEATAGFGTINIIDPATWEIQIPKQNLPVDSGSYDWQFKTVDAAGVARTLYGGTVKITTGVKHG